MHSTFRTVVVVWISTYCGKYRVLCISMYCGKYRVSPKIEWSMGNMKKVERTWGKS